MKRGVVAQALKLTAVVSLLGALQGAYANEDTSPVQVFDIQKWIEIRDRAKNSEKVMGLKNLIEIIYDKIISRPWEEADYWQEANKRWGKFQEAFCPSDLTLCELPKKLENIKQLEAIRNGIVDVQNHQRINSHLATLGLNLSPNLIFPVQSPVAESERDNFSFRITTVEAETGGEVTGTSIITHGDVIMLDIFSYRAGFTQDMARTYFAVDSKANGYIEADRVRENAVTMARIWKHAAQRVIIPNPIDTTDLLLQALKVELSADFETTYAKLLAKLDPKNEAHQEHIRRFQESRAKGQYPLEVYQWVSFDQLMRVTDVLVGHYQQAKFNYQNLHTINQSLKAIVSLQQQVSHRLMFYLLQRQWDLDDAGVLEQIVSKPVVGTYMLEHLKVVLEKEHYAEMGQFARYSPLLDYKLLTDDHDYLKENHPEFYQKMLSLDLLDSGKLRSAPLAIQRQWLEEYMTKNNMTELHQAGVYRLGAALMMGFDARAARDIAATIQKARLSRMENEI